MDKIQKLNNKKIKLKKLPVLTTYSIEFGPSPENSLDVQLLNTVPIKTKTTTNN